VSDVAEYPYFVFRSYQSDSLSFGETCKVYMCHLSEYQLVHLIESIFHWSNHFCYFVLQNMNMFVNLDLTPQQLCQRALLTICQSLYYKHDFSIILSATDLSPNYFVQGFVKYLDNFLHLIFQYKYFYERYTRFGAKYSSKIKISHCFKSSECRVPNKIGGCHHRSSIEKIKMEVIRPFVMLL
jgi:hypothetical protein